MTLTVAVLTLCCGFMLGTGVWWWANVRWEASWYNRLYSCRTCDHLWRRYQLHTHSSRCPMCEGLLDRVSEETAWMKRADPHPRLTFWAITYYSYFLKGWKRSRNRQELFQGESPLSVDDIRKMKESPRW